MPLATHPVSPCEVFEWAATFFLEGRLGLFGGKAHDLAAGLAVQCTASGPRDLKGFYETWFVSRTF